MDGKATKGQFVKGPVNSECWGSSQAVARVGLTIVLIVTILSLHV